MRFVAIALILLSFPIFVALLKQYAAKRDLALMAVGFMFFLVGTLQIDAAIISWRLWPGTSKGLMISPVDTLCLALLVTRRGQRFRAPLLGLVALYLVPIAISVVVSAVPTASLFILSQSARILIMFAAIAGEVRRPEAMRSLFVGIAAGVIVQGGFVIHEKLTGVVQARGTFPHQNILGMTVEIAAILMLAMVLEGERRKIIYLGLLAALIIVAGGGSRGTMGFIAMGLVLTILLSLVRSVTPRKLKILGLSVLAAMVVVPLGAATLSTRFDGGSVITEETVRASFEEAASMMADDNPFGVGANNYVTTANMEGYNSRAGVSWGGNNLTAPVHNSYLLAQAESGFLGLMVVVILMIAPIVLGLKIAFADRRSPIMGMGVGVAVAGFTVALHSGYEYAWHLESVQRLFFVNYAVLSGCILLRAQAKRARDPIRRSALNRGRPAT